MAYYSKKELKTKHNLQHCHKTMDECRSEVDFEKYDGAPFCSCVGAHKSWGAYVDENKNAHFKLFTFKDATRVSVEIKHSSSYIKAFLLEKTYDGIFELTLPPEEARENDKYKFVIERLDHTPIKVRDPYSKRQDDLAFWSVIYDHNRFKWTDYDWQNCKNKLKVSRIANEENGLTNIGNLRIYEVNIATLTNEGTFEAAKEEFRKIVENKHFNAVEIMPVENTYGYNWGYDGVDKFAVSHTLGGADKLKELIDYAHSINLNVIMDIVPNHLGVDMADLQNAGPYVDGANDFGFKFNFEKDDNKFVREFIINSAGNWIENYHCDGLRVDMTKFMKSDFTMKQMAAELNHHFPHSFLIAEDGRDNDPRVTKPFTEQEIQENDNKHCHFINKIAYNQVTLENLGFDSEWDFLYHKQIAAMVLGKWDYREKNIDNFDNAAKKSGLRVKYPMSHDEIGNIDGTRLITKIIANELHLINYICAKKINIKCQISAHIAHNLLKSLVTGELENMSGRQIAQFYEQNHLTKNFSIEEIKNAYEKALKLHRLAVAKTYSIPGPKMIFQGDDNGNMSYFKFFRKISTGYERELESKGYPPTIRAFLDSKLYSIDYSGKYKRDVEGTEELTKDLNDLMNDNQALQNGEIICSDTHSCSSIHAIHAKTGANEIFSISNFEDISYLNNCSINFPKGIWQEILNSNDVKYVNGNNGEFLNKNNIYAQECRCRCISLAPYGIVFFKKISD